MTSRFRPRRTRRGEDPPPPLNVYSIRANRLIDVLDSSEEQPLGLERIPSQSAQPAEEEDSQQQQQQQGGGDRDGDFPFPSGDDSGDVEAPLLTNAPAHDGGHGQRSAAARVLRRVTRAAKRAIDIPQQWLRRRRVLSQPSSRPSEGSDLSQPVPYDPDMAIAPSADMPRTLLAGMHPDFSYEVTPMLRIVRERVDTGDGRTINKVARYKERDLFRFGYLRLFKGTVFANPFLVWQMIGLWVLAFVVAAFVCLFSKMHGSGHHTDGSSAPAIDVDSLTDASETLQELVAFVLGFFLTKTVDIWWDLRLKYLQELFNVVDNMCMRMAIYFPHDTKEDELARETVLRYGLLSLALLFKDAREVDAWTLGEHADLGVSDLSDLIREGLLTKDEAARLSSHGVAARSQLVWVWISSLFTKWCLDGRLPDPFGNQNAMLEYSERARNQIGTILAQLNMQFPLEYEHLVTIMAKLLMLLMALETGIIWGVVWFSSETDASAEEQQHGAELLTTAISQSIMLTVMPVLYQGVIDIKERISNPFRDGYTDYSFKVFRSRLANECQAFFDAGLYPPYVPRERKAAAVLPPQFIERQISSAMYE